MAVWRNTEQHLVTNQTTIEGRVLHITKIKECITYARNHTSKRQALAFELKKNIKIKS